MKRLLSHSEISTAYDCQAKHAYSYTGALTGGDALKAKRVHVNLREGRAWGAGIAAWHYTGDKSAAHASISSMTARGSAGGRACRTRRRSRASATRDVASGKGARDMGPTLARAAASYTSRASASPSAS